MGEKSPWYCLDSVLGSMLKAQAPKWEINKYDNIKQELLHSKWKIKIKGKP